MEQEILIALLSKLIDERLAQSIGIGPRGPRGRAGASGRDFDFEEHEPKIREWVKEFALKFEDLTVEQLASLRGPRGREGKDGQDGQGFKFEEHRSSIELLVRNELGRISGDLKLQFSDLNEDDIGKLRGPRGRDGRDGRDFNFDDHREYFDSLKLRFSDLTVEEVEGLKLRFSQLTEEEKATLKLRFEDLTDEDRALIRGARGPRGQRGSTGEQGIEGKQGARGLPGPRGISGLPGRRGSDGYDGIHGADGKDAPYVVDVEVDQLSETEIEFVFKFSDGSEIKTGRVDLPASIVNYSAGGGGGSGGGSKVNYQTILDEVDADLTYVGKALPGYTSDQDAWQIQRIETIGEETFIQFADADALFDNVWDDRASLTYG